MVNWRNLEAAVDQKIGRSFGESVYLKFNRNGVTDPERLAVTINAILHVGGDDSMPLGNGDDRFRSRLSAGRAELFIDRSTYRGPDPALKDEVRAMDRAGKPWFEVLNISDRYSNLLVLSLGESV